MLLLLLTLTFLFQSSCATLIHITCPAGVGALVHDKIDETVMS